MTILDTIVEHKVGEVAARKRVAPASALQMMEGFRRTPLPFRERLRSGRVFSIIAEIKRSSPSAGMLVEHADPLQIARSYETHGAAAISVVTDERFFHGSLGDLEAVRHETGLPILRKDFIIDEHQIMEARACGADAVLLIAAVLDRARLADLHAAARELHLECLVEIYNEFEIDRIDFDAMQLVGINNRDLRTFTVDLQRSIRMRNLLPPGVTVVSESGIRSHADIQLLKQHNINAALVGEHLMRSGRPGAALRELLTGEAS